MVRFLFSRFCSNLFQIVLCLPFAGEILLNAVLVRVNPVLGFIPYGVAYFCLDYGKTLGIVLRFPGLRRVVRRLVDWLLFSHLKTKHSLPSLLIQPVGKLGLPKHFIHAAAFGWRGRFLFWLWFCCVFFVLLSLVLILGICCHLVKIQIGEVLI